MFEIVGASFTALTVSTKVSLVDSEPSLTVTVMVVEPNRLAVGVTVTVRMAPLPLKTTLPFGTRAGLEEVPVTIRLVAAVSASPTVKGRGPVDEFWLMVWLAMSEMVGAVLVVQFG